MIVRESLIRDTARLIVWYPVRWLVGMLPVEFAFRFFRVLARIHHLLTLWRFQSIRNNIRRAFPETGDIDSILKIYLENHYIDRLHIFTYPKLRDPAGLARICSFEGSGNLDQALRDGCGAIIVLGHFGPIQLPLFLLGQAGYSIIQVGLPTDEGLSWIGRQVAFRLRMKYERMIPVRILPADDFLRPLFHQLKDGGVVMMNIDPAGGGRWIGRLCRHRFFGSEIPFPLGSILLSRKTGAPILPLSIHRVAGGKYAFQLHPPIRQSPDMTTEDVSATLASWYESVVRQDPGLWHFWDEFEPGKLISRNPAEQKLSSQTYNPIL